MADKFRRWASSGIFVFGCYFSRRLKVCIRNFSTCFIGVVVVLTTSGCGSTGGVMPMGPDTFSVTASKHNMSGGAPDAESNALSSAYAHCNSLGKEMLVKNVSKSFERPIYNHSITFQCLNKNDPALVRPDYRNAPDVVIENRIK